MTAKDVYGLLSKSGMTSSKGRMIFRFMDFSAKVTGKSGVGYAFQEWLEKWLAKQGVKVKKKKNSQDWPDFSLDPDENNTKGVVEVKTFDMEKAPHFDIANFDAYRRSLISDAYRLDADYLIFGYKLSKNGVFIIENLWIKKVWEIATTSKAWPLNCQVKQHVIYNIRPGIWFSKSKKAAACFGSRIEFVKAIADTLEKYRPGTSEPKEWFDKVSGNYKLHTGRSL